VVSMNSARAGGGKSVMCLTWRSHHSSNASGEIGCPWGGHRRISWPTRCQPIREVTIATRPGEAQEISHIDAVRGDRAAWAATPLRTPPCRWARTSAVRAGSVVHVGGC